MSQMRDASCGVYQRKATGKANRNDSQSEGKESEMKKRLIAPLLAVFVLIAIAGGGIGKVTVKIDPVYLWGRL